MKRFMLFAYNYGSSSTSFGGMNDFKFSFETVEQFDDLFTDEFNYQICRANAIEVFDYVTEESMRIQIPRYGLKIEDKKDGHKNCRARTVIQIDKFISIHAEDDYMDFRDIEIIKDYLSFILHNEKATRSDFAQSLRCLTMTLNSVMDIKDFHPDKIKLLIDTYERNNINYDEIDTLKENRKIESFKWLEGFYRGCDI